MDTEQRSKNQVSYVFSREVILKKLLQEGIISDSEFEHYNQLLYDRYQMDADTGIPRPDNLSTPKAQEQSHGDTSTEYISLTVEAKEVFEDNPGYAIQSWLRDSNTIAFLHYWEQKNNANFNFSGYEALIEELKAPAATLSTKKSGLIPRTLSAYNPNKEKMAAPMPIRKLPVPSAPGYARNFNTH